jgi:excisionase family DNA binding protein
MQRKLTAPETTALFEDGVSLAPIPRLALSLREAAQATGLSERTIKELSRANQIPLVRVGRRVLVPVAALELWLQNNSRALEV